MPLALDLEPALARADLVVAAVVLQHAPGRAARSADAPPAAGSLAIQSSRADSPLSFGATDEPIRFIGSRTSIASGPQCGLVARAQLPRDAQIVLAPVGDDDEAAVDDVHVLVDAHGELQRAAAARSEAANHSRSKKRGSLVPTWSNVVGS